MQIQVILEPSDEGGFTATVSSLPGCISEGNTKKEALKNIKEAVELYLEPVDDELRFNPNAQVLEIALWQKSRIWIMDRLLMPYVVRDG